MNTKRSFIVIFIALSSVQAGRCQNLDIEWLREANLNRNQNWDGIMKGVSHSVMPVVIAAPIAEITIGLTTKDSAQFSKGIATLGAVSLNYVLTTAFKATINRDRPFVTYPDLAPLYRPTDGSIPSGHTSGAFTLATSLALNYPKWYVLVPAYTWAGWVGYSRLHLGVHYPTDLLLGAGIGIGSAFAAHYLNGWIQGKFNYTKILRLQSGNLPYHQ